jgi:hypothetical protein
MFGEHTKVEFQEPPSHSIFELHHVLKVNDIILSILDSHDYSPPVSVLGSNIRGNKDIVTDVETIHLACLMRVTFCTEGCVISYRRSDNAYKRKLSEFYSLCFGLSTADGRHLPIFRTSYERKRETATQRH